MDATTIKPIAQRLIDDEQLVESLRELGWIIDAFHEGTDLVNVTGALIGENINDHHEFAVVDHHVDMTRRLRGQCVPVDMSLKPVRAMALALTLIQSGFRLVSDDYTYLLG